MYLVLKILTPRLVGNPDTVDTTLSSVISQTKIPLRLQSEQEGHHANDDGFYAEITPLHSNGAETVEIVLLAVASSDPRNSEKDAQPAYDASHARVVDFDIALAEKAIDFLPPRQHAEPAGPSVASKKATHTPVDIRSMGVHSTHLDSEPLDLFTPRYLSLQKNPGKANTPHETSNAQYAPSGFVICYQLPQETLDQEAGTVVVAVRSPEPLPRQT